MKNKLLAILITCLLSMPFAAKADAILLGEWNGLWTGVGVTAQMDMTVTSETAGTFSGYIDWQCLTGFACSGREFFSGTLSGLSFAFDSYALQNAFNLGLASYWGSVAADGLSLSGVGAFLGTETVVGSFSLSRAVPEPGTLALLLLGIACITAAGRRGRAPR